MDFGVFVLGFFNTFKQTPTIFFSKIDFFCISKDFSEDFDEFLGEKSFGEVFLHGRSPLLKGKLTFSSCLPLSLQLALA